MRGWDISRLTPNRLRIFVTVVDRQSIRAAARELALSEVAVRQNLSELTEVTGGSTLLTRGGRDGRLVVPTVHGRRVHAAAGSILAQTEALARLGSSQHVVAFQSRHASFVARAVHAMDGLHDIELRMLVETDSSGSSADERAVRDVEDGVVDLLVGPPSRCPDKHPVLRFKPLYTARLEAMVEAGSEQEFVEVADLIRRPLLLPPPGVYGRTSLETHFTEMQDVNPAVVLESADAAALVLFGREGAGTVVLPSDVALAFKAGHEAAGSPDSFRWVPVRHHGSELTDRVGITLREDSGATLDALHARLGEAVRCLPQLGDVVP